MVLSVSSPPRWALHPFVVIAMILASSGRTFLISRLALAALALCSAGAARAEPPGVSVAAAASLKPVLDELAAAFQRREPNTPLRVSYGASATLLAQLANGAPFDLFLSADREEPARAAERGLADGAPFLFAHGQLAVWVPNGSPLRLERDGLAALEDPSVRRIAIANPDVAPYGRAARAALESAGLWSRLGPRLVTGRNVAQAAQFAESGNAEAALVALSLARAPPLATAGRCWVVPARLHGEALAHAGIIVRNAPAAAAAARLRDLLLGPEGRAALVRHGYQLPER